MSRTNQLIIGISVATGVIVIGILAYTFREQLFTFGTLEETQPQLSLQPQETGIVEEGLQQPLEPTVGTFVTEPDTTPKVAMPDLGTFQTGVGFTEESIIGTQTIPEPKELITTPIPAETIEISTPDQLETGTMVPTTTTPTVTTPTTKIAQATPTPTPTPIVTPTPTPTATPTPTPVPTIQKAVAATGTNDTLPLLFVGIGLGLVGTLLYVFRRKTK